MRGGGALTDQKRERLEHQHRHDHRGREDGEHEPREAEATRPLDVLLTAIARPLGGLVTEGVTATALRGGGFVEGVLEVRERLVHPHGPPP